MMKGFLNIIKIVVLVLFVSLSFIAQASSFPKSIRKKINKEVKKLFPIENLTMNKIEDFKFDNFKYQDIKNVSLSKLKCTDELMGYACFASSKGKNDYFDYMVLLDESLEIKKVVVLIYRSSYGGEIMAKSWLKQFVGKVKGEEMEFEKDIDGISGATISGPSMIKGVKTVSLMMNELKEKGEI